KTTIELKTSEAGDRDGMGSYIRAAVRRWLAPWAEANGMDIYADGFRIYTTIDSRMQRYAEEAVSEQMETLQERFIRHWQGQQPWRDEEGNVIEDFIMEKARSLPDYKQLMEKFNGEEDTVLALLGTPREMTVFTWEGDTTVLMSPLKSLAYYAKF